MMDWETEEKVINLRNEISKELKLSSMSFTDFNRQVVIENSKGEEELIDVKEVSYEAKPNTRPGANERIIKDFSEKFGWEYVTSIKQAWVDGWILHRIFFKL